MTIKVLFAGKRGEGNFTMLFGDSYKSWKTQFEEFTYRYYTPKGEGWNYENVEGVVLRAWKSKTKWIGWGGLKWCREENFQEELNREGCQQAEPDNPNPRQYSDFEFKEMDVSILEKVLRS